MVWRVVGSGDPLVLLHGGAGSWTHWSRNVAALSRGHRLYIPDMPGFGASDALPLTDSLDPLAAALLDGIDTLAGRGAFHLVGFSFGGLVASQVARRAGPRLRRLVLVGASGFGLPTSLRLPLRSWRGLPLAEEEAAHRHNLRVLMLAGEIGPEALRLQRANARRARLNSRPWSARPILRDALADLRVPLGAIWGGADAIVQGDLDQRIALLRRSDPACPVAVLDGAGHWVAFEAPERFAAALQPMIDGPA